MVTSGSALRTGAMGAVLALLLGCAPTYMPPLTSRGIPAEERRDFIIQNGFGIPEPVKQAFLDGYLVEGMPKELVFHLFGAPDRASDKDALWEYVNRKGQLITSVRYKDDKIEHIDGDPSGGANKTAAPPPLPGP